MKTTIELLQANAQVSGYKINIHKKESCELFFVKGKLETVRRTNTCDKEVTVYVDHGVKTIYYGEAYAESRAPEIAAMYGVELIHVPDYPLSARFPLVN